MLDDDRQALQAFISQLVQLHEDAGAPTLLKLRRLSEQTRADRGRGLRVLAESTTHEILTHKRKRWPDWEWVASFALSCMAAAEQAPGVDAGRLGGLDEWRARFLAARAGRGSGSGSGIEITPDKRDEREEIPQHSTDAAMRQYLSYFGRSGGRLLRHARAGDNTAAYHLGVLLCCAGHEQEAKKWLRQAADSGHNEASELYHNPMRHLAATEAAYRLAHSYEHADNMHLAALFYQHAADTGDLDVLVRPTLIHGRPENMHPALVEAALGTQLQRLRKARGFTYRDATYVIRLSISKIGNMEDGQVGFKEHNMADPLTIYGVCGENERAKLLAFLHEGDSSGWWREYSDVPTSGVEPYMRLERAASVIRTYEFGSIPSLLQTENYARAIIRLCYPDVPQTQLERRVSQRMNRQQLLHRQDAPKLWVVIDEAALHRPIGSTTTMRRQLEHLIQLAEYPQVAIQVLASNTDHATVDGSITILRFSDPDLRDLVYLEQLSGVLYLDQPADIAHYLETMDRLAVRAERPPSSTAILHQALKMI